MTTVLPTTSGGRARQAIVVGGGPGGLMAAEVLATGGFAVTVVEHMASVGRKLLLAGRGGLNVTQNEPVAHLLTRYGPASGRLTSAIHAFRPDDLRDWCMGLGQATFVGSSGKVFPDSFRATPLLRAWLTRLSDLGVEFRVRTKWRGWATDETGAPDPRRLVFASRDDEAFLLEADVVVFALGGASWPRVGSDGRWVDRFRSAGVTVTDLHPANCGLRLNWTPSFSERWNGEPLKNIAVSVTSCNNVQHKAAAVRGDAIITRSGIEGGPVYAHVATIRHELERTNSATIYIDLHPDLDVEAVTARLLKRRDKDSLSTTMRKTLRLSPVAIALLRESTSNGVSTMTVGELARLVKRVPLVVDGLMPIDRAISTAGGVAFDELDDGFMLRSLPGTFVVGEMLDWEAPTGGYLLQATFSTAVAAARAALAYSHAH